MTATGSRRRKRELATWIGVIAAPLGIVALLLLAFAGGGVGQDGPDEAPDFTLPTTHGDRASLDDALAGGDALLFFSMGAGCDGCFVQIPELAEGLEERDLELVSIMPGDVEIVAAEAERLGVADPILVDADAEVSDAYGMLGQYGHGDVPSHSFALVREDGDIAWVRHYAEMFVPAEAFFGELDPELG